MRSLLFVPGDSERKQARALESGADALILDLEDSIAPSRKAEAREITAAFLRAARARTGRLPKLFVRVNDLTTGLTDDDLAAVVPAAPDGIVLPKAVGGRDVTALDARLAVAEAESGLPDGATRILAIATETAASLFVLGSFAGSSPRLVGLTWGGEDLSADIGAETNRLADGSYTDPYRLARALTVIAAASARVLPIDSVFTAYRDLDRLWDETEAGRRDGFQGKLAIHPDQVPVINTVFTPSAEAVARAQAIVAAFAAEPGAGVVGFEGLMLDRPHLARAQHVLDRARDAGA